MLSHCPSYKILFGDDLQTELTHTKATNKIGVTASSPITSGKQATQVVGPVKDTIFSGERLSSAGRRITNFKVTRGAITIKRRSTNDQPVSRKNHHVIDKLQSLEVSQLTTFILLLVDYFKSQASSFQAGRIAHCIDAWKSITADSEILTSVCGELILFTTIPVQRKVPFQPVWKRPKSEFIANEILSLLHKGVIIPSQHEPDEFIPPIFRRDE